MWRRVTESLMRVVSIRRSAAAWVRRAEQAVQKFFGPFEPETPGLRARPIGRGVAPLGVWYGRSVFCFRDQAPDE